MLAPPLVSLVSGVFGLEAYPVILAVLTAIMAVSIFAFVVGLKKQGKYNGEI